MSLSRKPHGHMIVRSVSDAIFATIGKQVSQQPIELVVHRPEPWARPTDCFRNVARKIAECGGSAQSGYTFHHRFAQNIEGLPLYIYLTHHAVWVSPEGERVDVTPYPERRHAPLDRNGKIKFLPDDAADPIMVQGQPAPLPLRFFAVDDNKELKDYVAELNRKEQEACRELHSQGSAQNASET
ncbi:hypothetical protein [Bradyrhizobium sp. SZCCHNRI20481]|uniref:hypothetical protein n=1 Tax=Bradyrhizobium sp. SZCCHNRI20481 TaxID=3057286 RepID=UPI0029164CAB|nr:hypothetical protein [Bradyrhizobium sp. SZCCHNRI20481]